MADKICQIFRYRGIRRMIGKAAVHIAVEGDDIAAYGVQYP